MKEGALIEKGQMIVRLEWQERAKLLASEKKDLVLLESELRRVQKVADEAKARYETALKFALELRKVVGPVDTSERKLLSELYAAELAYTKAKLAYAKYSLDKLQELEKDPAQKYPVLRSPVRGVIKSILKRPGETVKQGEPILIIQVKEE